MAPIAAHLQEAVQSEPVEEPSTEEKAYEKGLFSKGFSEDHGLDRKAAALTPGQRIGQKILHHPVFEHTMAAVIIMNFVVVIVETDAGAKNDPSPKWTEIMSWILLITFVCELVLKMFTLRSRFHHEAWNIFDFIVISVDLVFSLLAVFLDGLFSVSGLRILRLARLARASKIVEVFPELRLMMAGLAGAMNAIFWGTLLLFGVLLIFSVMAVQFIHPLNLEIHYSSDCGRCIRAYSTTFQSALTFATQIVAGDSWGRETVPIIEAYPLTAFFFAAVYLSVGMALLNLILGVVVNVATEERARIVRQMEQERHERRKDAHDALEQMCADMDEDGNAELTYAEVQHGYANNAEFRETLEAMEIGEQDLDVVWAILDADRSGTISTNEFVSQVYELKSSESKFLLAYIKFYLTEIADTLKLGQRKLKDELQAGHEELVHRALERTHGIRKSVNSSHEFRMSLNGGANFHQKIADVDQRIVDVDAPDIEGTSAKVQNGITYENGKDEKPIQAGAITSNGEVACEREVTSATNQSQGDGTARQVSGDKAEKASNDASVANDREPLQVESLQLKFAREQSSASISRSTADNAELYSQLHSVWLRCLHTIDGVQEQHTELSQLLLKQAKCVSSVLQRLSQAASVAHPLPSPEIGAVNTLKARACVLCGTITETTL